MIRKTNSKFMHFTKKLLWLRGLFARVCVCVCVCVSMCIKQITIFLFFLNFYKNNHHYSKVGLELATHVAQDNNPPFYISDY